MEQPCFNCPGSEDDDGMRVERWAVWYDDGVVREGSTLDEWWALPADGVLAMALWYDREGYGRTAAGANAYFAAEGTLEPIYGHAESSEEEILGRYKNASVKLGRWADDATMRIVDRQVSRAMNPETVG